ncbi:MAG TPA: trypsin-like peptidase domain-containing protein [Fimbriiglobus sp.]|nr:trypsin-like peptidase domain-containing protein [Fimbriiglobus sp.]
MTIDPEYPAPASRPRLAKQSGWPVAVAVVVCLVLGALLLWWLVPKIGGNHQPGLDPNATQREPAPRSPLDAEEQQAVAVFESARDSVVNVDTMVRVRRLDMRVQEQQTGTGSGFFWDDAGRIVTNFHVVREAAANPGAVGLRVVLADRTSWDAEIVGVAPDYDLAVLAIGDPSFPQSKVKKIKVGSSADLKVGQKAFAIGNPFALSLTMTKGIISALDRQIESLTDRPIAGAIQHSAQINPGNSGGPLLDKDGRLIGVNSQIATPSGGNVGIGFAIPVDTVNTVVTELIQRGRILKPDLGIKLVDQRTLRRAGFPDGVMIREVEPDSPASKAGLRGLGQDPQTGDVVPGDLILSIDGHQVDNPADLARLVADHKVGDKVRLTIERDDKRSEVEVTLRGV